MGIWVISVRDGIRSCRGGRWSDTVGMRLSASQPMPIYFTGDHHFGHAAARSFYRRPFASVAEMDQEMIDRWNSVVSPGNEDEVWHLGDFAVRQTAERVARLLGSLHGRKHLVVGNNDDAVVTGCNAWQSVQPYAEVTADGKKLVPLPLSLPHLAGHGEGIDQSPRP